MMKPYLLAALLVLAPLLVSCQGVPSSPSTISSENLANSAVMTTLNNYFGCSIWSGNNCVKCSVGYYFNAKGICCQVQPTCQQFNVKQGICEQCYQGYFIVNGSCTLTNIADTTLLGCAIWVGSKCMTCSQRYYFNQQNVCVPVSDFCSTWSSNGACNSCYGGYVLSSGTCVVNTNTNYVTGNPLCQTFSGQTCIACASRSYFNVYGICTTVSAQCNTFDKASGRCLSCFSGYAISNGECVLSSSNNGPVPDLGCARWDWNNKLCLQCSQRWNFNTNGACVPVSNDCATYSSQGACQSCYNGYTFINGQCVASVPIKPVDPGCGTWDWNNQRCIQCSQGWVFGGNNVCQVVNNQCKTNDANGNCLTCYNGYNVIGGQCALAPVTGPTQVGCATWDWNKQICLQCSNGWVFNYNGVCQVVSDQCKSHDSNGNCKACFVGYTLIQGQCNLAPITGPTQLGCGKWDWNNQVCLQCSQGYVSNNGICQVVPAQCKTNDNFGNCLTCYTGYNVQNGQCVLSTVTGPTQLGCGKWDWTNQVCLQCSQGYVYNNGICQVVNNQCKTNDNFGNCLTCYTGYNVQNGQCVLTPVTGPTQIGCGKWDWNNQICLQCSQGYFYNNGVCQVVNSQCKTNDNFGNCLTCYNGYSIQNGQCALAPITGPSQIGCGKWDWNNQVCLQCSQGYIYNNGICQVVNNQCKTYDNNGNCLTCYVGYSNQNGQCVLAPITGPSQIGCGKWDWTNQVCLQCSQGYVYNNGICQVVNNQCKTYDNFGNCLTCYTGYTLNQGQCNLAPVTGPTQIGCGKWDWANQVCLQCSQGYIASNGVCQVVSNQCKTYDNFGNCLTCYTGYNAQNGQCLLAPVNGPSQIGCGKWDWTNQVCLQCSQSYVFNSNGVCQAVSSQCKTYDNFGNCLTCYTGYNNQNGQCVLAPQNGPNDLGCAQWDWNNQICLRCSKGWVFNSNNVCQVVSNQCKAFDNSGRCTDCYKGYNLQNGQCVLAPQNGPSDVGCAQWDWNNQVCLKCSQGWIFNVYGVCQSVSSQCKAYDNSGRCTDCYKGYALLNGECVLAQ
jgi:hypothetical protein